MCRLRLELLCAVRCINDGPQLGQHVVSLAKIEQAGVHVGHPRGVPCHAVFLRHAGMSGQSQNMIYCFDGVQR